MTVMRVLLISVLAVMCMYSVTCNISSDSPNPKANLMIPYHGQEYINYCSIACIQMWAEWDGNMSLTQNQIAQEVGIAGTSYLANPYDVERAVGVFTNSMGYLEIRNWLELGAEGDIIASTIEGIKYSTPSIIPINYGLHTILMKGYEWTEKDEKPFAIRAYYHDPYNNMHDRNVPASLLLFEFDPAPDYWAILGWEYFVWNGAFGHDMFVLQGGTYYGGPSYYNPKNLDLTQLEN
jgi:hypothetical protein